MTRASIPTLLSTDRFGQIMSINPWYFSQANTTVWTGQDNSCDPFWLQYAWMDADKVGREDLARAIAQAEADMARELRYWPAPKWLTNEDHQYEKHFDKALLGIRGVNSRWQGKSVRTDWGYVRAVGQEAKTAIAGSALNYVTDVATITVATTVTEASEIGVFFRVADGADEAGSNAYRIRPVKVTISGGVATITARKWLFIKPTLWEAVATIDGDAVASFVTSVDVYRVYNDPSAMAMLMWETIPEGCASGDEGCAYSEQTACLLMRDTQLGLLVPSPGEWEASSETFTPQSLVESWEPDKVRINYQAGYPLGADGEMDDTWARAVAYYAAALLGREGCDCQYFGNFLRRWQEDMALNRESGQSYQNSQVVLDNPFGTERGAVFAWQRVKKAALGRGFAL